VKIGIEELLLFKKSALVQLGMSVNYRIPNPTKPVTFFGFGLIDI